MIDSLGDTGWRERFAIVACWMVVTASLLLAPAVSHGQSIRGVVFDQINGPVAGVVVELLDRGTGVSARTLTNARGEFGLTAASPGTFRVRAMRIGFHPTVSTPVSLKPGSVFTHRLELNSVPLLLDSIRGGLGNACLTLGEPAAETIEALWEQARTAIAAAQLTADEWRVDATSLAYDRTVDSDSGHRVLTQRSTIHSGFAAGQRGVRAPDSLREIGYVVTEADSSTTYHGPSLELLQSSAFSEDHCFRVALSSDSSLLGIAFEPTPNRRVAELRGVLWLDRQSSKLRSLEYSYVNIPPLQAAESGGEMEFVRLGEGGWAVSRSYLRMPVLEQRTSAQGTEMHVAEVRIMGRELILVNRGRDTLWSRRPLALQGTVMDSVSAAVTDARVILLGTLLESVTDSKGQFTISGVLPGEYTVEVRTASLDSVDAIHRSVLAIADGAAPINLRVPTRSEVASALCGARQSDNGIILGRVAVRGDSLPASDVRVSAEWKESLTNSVLSGNRSRWLEARTDSRGTFRMCGVPVGIDLVLRAVGDTGNKGRLNIQIPPSRRLVRAEVRVDGLVATTAVFTGTIFVDSTEQPIANAEVALPGLLKSVLTDNGGRFRITEIPAGEQRIVVRRIGYGPLDTNLVFGANAAVNRRIFLSRVTMLDTVVVEARAVIPSFEEHRALGLGRFITRAQLEKQENRRLSDVLSEISGAQVTRGRSAAWVSANRGTRSLSNTVLLDTADVLQGARRQCYSLVFSDNAMVYRGMDFEPLFNIHDISPHEIEAIEYYASPAQTPLKYSVLNSACGVLVIWTRRTP